MKKRAVIAVNTAVLLFGLAGLFAKWIQQPALVITFGRVFFSSAALGIWMLFRRQSFHVDSGKDLLLMMAAGAVLAVHWWCFLASIQISTVAVGTITFSSFPLFVTFFEPLIFHQRLRLRNIVFALIILIGVVVTVPEFSAGNDMFVGIMTGMASSLAYAALTLVNKALSGRYSGTLTAFYEQTTAAAVLLPFVLEEGIHMTGTDIGLLLFLGIVTTAFAHTLFISSLKELPAQLAGVWSSMESVYSILFAVLLLGEIPSVREIIGAVIIVGAVAAAQMKTGQDPAFRPADTDRREG